MINWNIFTQRTKVDSRSYPFNTYTFVIIKKSVQVYFLLFDTKNIVVSKTKKHKNYDLNFINVICTSFVWSCFPIRFVRFFFLILQDCYIGFGSSLEEILKVTWANALLRSSCLHDHLGKDTSTCYFI